MDIFLKRDLLYLQGRSCYFHWLQPILAQHHLVPLLTSTGKFAAFIHSVNALPYVSAPDVIEVYEDVLMTKLKDITESSNPAIVTNLANIEKVVSYLDHTWIGKREAVEGEAANGEVLKKYTPTPPLLTIKDWSNMKLQCSAGPGPTTPVKASNFKYFILVLTI
jgi:hypothetical protein